MVRSRSETNLNRIFVDLCTSPDIRTKHKHDNKWKRQYHPPLPNLQPIKSNSCSNIHDLEETFTGSTISFTSDENEQQDIPDTPVFQNLESPAIPLVPMESTGFIVQGTNPIPVTPNRSLKLFETLAINHITQSSTTNSKPKSKPKSEPEPESDTKSDILPTPTNPSNILHDWKQQDFTNRLQNRLKSRGHLRKYFLS